MTPLSKRLAIAAAIMVAAAAGYWGGHIVPLHKSSVAGIAQPSGPIVYYKDPNGRPFYSLTPRKTDDGKAYVGVLASEDISVDPKPASQAQAGKKIIHYRNPMGLPDISLVPKKDSMGMDYIAVYDGEDSDDGSVKLSPGRIQRTGVKSEPAARRAIRSTVRAPGTIQLDERRVSVVAMRSESFLLKVADVTTGSHVVKGQPLMEVYSPSITSAAAEYLATITSRTTSGDIQYGRGSRQRLMNLDVPEVAISAIEKNRIVPTSIEWSSPRDGIILERNAIEGMRVQPGGVLFRIADHSVMWALIDIAERDLGLIARGQPVSVWARSFPGREFTGRVEVIYPEIKKETRTARVRVELQNPDLVLLHDMYVDAEIDTGSGEAVVTVPESAVLDSGSRQAVLIDQGEGRFEPRDVKLGHRGGGYVEIREGVKEDEQVVVSANFLIDAESNLKASLKGLSEAGAQP
jgi:Cu(I)/Ag(I) efflux system membrane fusion protein